jgi:hypothetical protein
VNPIFVVIWRGKSRSISGARRRCSAGATAVTFDLPAGGISINASGLHPETPFGRFIGIRITGGTATFSVAPLLAGNTLRVSPSASLILEINPEVPAAATYFEPPSKARLTFDADALTGFTAETATISTFGAVVQISPRGLPIFGIGGPPLRGRPDGSQHRSLHRSCFDPDRWQLDSRACVLEFLPRAVERDARAGLRCRHWYTGRRSGPEFVVDRPADTPCRWPARLPLHRSSRYICLAHPLLSEAVKRSVTQTDDACRTSF